MNDPCPNQIPSWGVHKRRPIKGEEGVVPQISAKIIKPMY